MVLGTFEEEELCVRLEVIVLVRMGEEKGGAPVEKEERTTIF